MTELQTNKRPIDDIVSQMEQLTLQIREKLTDGDSDSINNLSLIELLNLARNKIDKSNDGELKNLYTQMIDLIKEPDMENKKLKMEDIIKEEIDFLEEKDTILLYEDNESDEDEDSKSNEDENSESDDDSEDESDEYMTDDESSDESSDDGEEDELMSENSEMDDEEAVNLLVEDKIDEIKKERNQTSQKDLSNEEIEELKKETQEELELEIKDENEDELNTTYMMLLENLEHLEEKETEILSFYFPKAKFTNKEINNIELLKKEIEDYIPFSEFTEYQVKESEPIDTENKITSKRMLPNKQFYKTVPEGTTIEELEFYNDMVDESIEMLEKFAESKNNELYKLTLKFHSKVEAFDKFIHQEDNSIFDDKKISPYVSELAAEREYFKDNIYDYDYYYDAIDEFDEKQEEFKNLYDKMTPEQKEVYKKWELEYETKLEKEYITINLIRDEQQNTDLIFDKNVIKKLVNEIAPDYNSNINFTQNALEAIQTAAEAYLIELYEKANKITTDNNRTGITVSDIKNCKK